MATGLKNKFQLYNGTIIASLSPTPDASNVIKNNATDTYKNIIGLRSNRVGNGTFFF